MKNASHWAKFVLVLALAWMNVAAARAAATLTDFQALMPSPVRGIVGNLADLQDQKVEKGWLSARGSLFNQSATIYLYWPGKKDLDKVPIVVVPLTELNAKVVFDSILKVPSELDVGLKSPILFWLPERFGVADLERAKMPDKVPDRAGRDTGLPETVRMNPGLNLFGRVASGFLGDLLKTVNLDANNLTAGLATGKDAKGAAVYVVGLTMASEWKNPFGLDQTSITGATVRVIKEKVSQSKTIETWGTVRIKAKDYTAYLQRSGLSETLAFDTKDASLKQFFDIADVVSSTLGLPKVPFPSELPVDKVTLRNDRYVSKLDPASPPKFDNMMFMGSKGVSSDDPKLYINSSAYVYGWQAGKGYVKASKQGVDGDFAMSLPKIGPIGASSGKFYLKVVTSGLGKFSTSPAMGIKLAAPLFGDMDLKASSSGLKLVAAPSCPLRPFGFTADVTDLTKADFPITPMLGDCFSKALDDLVDGAEGAYKEAEPFVVDTADETAGTAEGLYNTAVTNIDKYAVQRAGDWGKELADLKSVKDSALYARTAYDEADKQVKWLGNEIVSLGSAISTLTSEIENLAQQVWSAISSGTLTGKRKERTQKSSTRDDYLAQEPAAMTRRDEAKKIYEKKTKEAAQFSSPYVAASIASTQEPLLGAMSQTAVQAGIVGMLRTLPAELKKDGQKRKEFFAKAGTPDNLLKVRQASENKFSTYRNLSDLVKAGGDQASGNLLSGAKKNLISQAVAVKVGADTERLLDEAVSTLPTMAYDMNVYMVLDRPGEPNLCLAASRPVKTGVGLHLEPCSRSLDWGPDPQALYFTASGRVFLMGLDYLYLHAKDTDLFSKVINYDKRDSREYSDLALFFFDPIDGLVHYMAADATPLCLRAAGERIVGGACPGPKEDTTGARWRLAGPADVARSTALVTRSAAKQFNLPGLASHSRTNLAPLKLKPRKLK